MKRKFFDEGSTRSYEFRISGLKKLKTVIKKKEDEIIHALYEDLHKPVFEAFTSEVGIVYEEINHAIKNLKSWMKPERVSTPLALQPSRSKIYSEPLGVVLIIGPWNYPFQLILSPLVGAIAAGNCAIVKPSNQASHVGEIVQEIIEEVFSEEYASVVQGAGSILGPLLIENFSFDHIFFTGSLPVGRDILKMAADHLSPVTLELGGKSPAIVHKDANIDISAKRIIWAKYFNAGQTCVCPDYLLVHEDIKDKLIHSMKTYIKEFFGEKPIESESFGRIINQKRFEILEGFLEEGNIIVGGAKDKETKYIAPTIIDGINLDNQIMKEEIFGPILPVLTYKQIDEVVHIVRENPFPLSLYLFTRSKELEEFILETIQFGGGCINNGIVHLVNIKLPFGGIGNSGIGSYHGKYSFDLFSHKKSILKTAEKFEPNLKYPPYTETKVKVAKKLFK